VIADDEVLPARIPPPRPAMVLDALTLALAALALFVVVADRQLFIGSRWFMLPSVPFLLAATVIVFTLRHVIFRGAGIFSSFAIWRARLDAYPDTAAAVRAFVATRPAVFIVAHFAVVTIGLAPKASFTLSSDPFGNLPARFDAGWYGGIALDGYEWDGHFDRQRNFAFFPALPMLMRPLGTVFGMKAPGLPRERRMLRALWAAVAISLAAFLLALVYLARLTRLLAGADAAVSAPLLLAAYPFAAFFNAPYTEGLFLLGSVGAFYHFHQRRWLMASLFGLLVGFSRPNGCLVSVPLGLMAAQATWQDWRGGRDQAPPLRLIAQRFLVAAMPGMAMLIFTAFLRWLTGFWFAWARIQGAWGREMGTRPIAQGWEWLTTEGFMQVSRGVPFDLLNTLAVVFVALWLIPIFRRLGTAYGLFVLLNLVPPLFAGGALSMGRISSTLFPVFMVLAAQLPRQTVPAWASAFAMLQGLVAALFFTWREMF
jgi:Mannosyltransferase (PIG-V)